MNKEYYERMKLQHNTGTAGQADFNETAEIQCKREYQEMIAAIRRGEK